jgi:hypothetical protein
VQRGVRLFWALRKQQLDEGSRQVRFGRRQFDDR